MPDHVKMTIIDPDGNEISRWTIKGQTVWEAMEVAGWDTNSSCGGQGTCSKCKFRMSGGISELTPAEKERLIPDELSSGQRIACLVTVEDDFTVNLDYWPGKDYSKTNLLQYKTGTVGHMGVSNQIFFIPGREAEAPQPIYDRIKNALSSYRLELSADNINYLARLDRQGRPALELHGVILDDVRVIQVGRQRETLLGLALDIGSTSLFAALLDLETGQMLAMASHSNLQRIYGEDIIARVHYANEHEDGGLTLQRILLNNINSMIDEMLAATGAKQANIYKVTVAGNPVMLHLFLGISVAGFGTAPYRGVFSADICMPAQGLGLKVNTLGTVHILPQLGGFVGADTTACLLTLQSVQEQTFLLIDIGTNGEIVLNHRGAMWAASAAAGPAFEGGALSCGMRAGQGAVDKVVWDNGQLDFRVIGGGIARGICGSGIIDLLSVLLLNGFIDSNGMFTDRAVHQFKLGSGARGLEMILAHDRESLSTARLVFNQEDIRQIQLASAAIRTAIELILTTAELDISQVEYVYMAGAFGNYVEPASLINIGLLPGFETGKIRNIGNAAATGAIMALLSEEKAREAAELKSKIKCIELADQESFQELFVKNLNFPPLDK